MLRKILPHAAILLSNMYIVFFFIDRVNTAMQFINNSITKFLLLLLCIITTINSSFLILDERRKVAARNRRQNAAQRPADPRHAAPATTARSAAAARPMNRTGQAQRAVVPAPTHKHSH